LFVGTAGASSTSFTKDVTVRAPAGRIEYDYGWKKDFKKAFGTNATVNLTVTDL
jgi:hypothetical protein